MFHVSSLDSLPPLESITDFAEESAQSHEVVKFIHGFRDRVLVSGIFAW